MSNESGFPRAAAALRESAEEILAGWEARVRSARGLSSGEPGSAVLRDDIPEMIEALASGLAPPASEGAIPDRAPYDHALQRFTEDVPLPTLVEEYRILRSALFDLLAREALDELPRAWPYVANHLDRAIEEAVAQYSEQRMRWLAESEQEIEAVLRELPVGVAVADAKTGRLVRANRQMAKIQAGVAEAGTVQAAAQGVEHLSGAPCTPDEVPLARALRGEETGAEEYRVYDPSGNPVAVEVRARPLRGPGGDVRGAVAIVSDVSERMRSTAERQLIAATLGHDVRSPLSTIRVAAQRLQQVETSSLVHKLSGGIVRSSSKLTDLVTELLDVARSRDQAPPLSREPIDLAELCREVIADRSAARAGPEIRLHVPVAVEGMWDRRRLVRIVENLVDNAEKYGEAAWGVDIHVYQEAAMAVLAVSNRGSFGGGEMPSRRLFEPYRRGDGGAVGSGLGLYIVKEFSEAHGGVVKVQSEQGITTLRVFLPVGETSGAAEPG